MARPAQLEFKGVTIRGVDILDEFCQWVVDWDCCEFPQPVPYACAIVTVAACKELSTRLHLTITAEPDKDPLQLCDYELGLDAKIQEPGDPTLYPNAGVVLQPAVPTDPTLPKNTLLTMDNVNGWEFGRSYSLKYIGKSSKANPVNAGEYRAGKREFDHHHVWILAGSEGISPGVTHVKYDPEPLYPPPPPPPIVAYVPAQDGASGAEMAGPLIYQGACPDGLQFCTIRTLPPSDQRQPNLMLERTNCLLPVPCETDSLWYNAAQGFPVPSPLTAMFVTDKSLSEWVGVATTGSSTDNVLAPFGMASANAYDPHMVRATSGHAYSVWVQAVFLVPWDQNDPQCDLGTLFLNTYVMHRWGLSAPKSLYGALVPEDSGASRTEDGRTHVFGYTLNDTPSGAETHVYQGYDQNFTCKAGKLIWETTLSAANMATAWPNHRPTGVVTIRIEED